MKTSNKFTPHLVKVNGGEWLHFADKANAERYFTANEEVLDEDDIITMPHQLFKEGGVAFAREYSLATNTPFVSTLVLYGDANVLAEQLFTRLVNLASSPYTADCEPRYASWLDLYEPKLPDSCLTRTPGDKDEETPLPE